MIGISLKVGRAVRHVSKSPRVTTSDPEKKQTRLKLSVDAVAAFDSTMPVTIAPERVSIPPEKKTDQFRLAVKNVSSEPVTPRPVFIPDDIVDVKLPRKIAPGEEGTILVKLKDDYEWKNYKTSLTIVMSDENLTRYTIPVEIGTFVRTKAKTPAKPKTVSSSTTTKKTDSPIRPTGSKGSGSN